MSQVAISLNHTERHIKNHNVILNLGEYHRTCWCFLNNLPEFTANFFDSVWQKIKSDPKWSEQNTHKKFINILAGNYSFLNSASSLKIINTLVGLSSETPKLKS